MNCQQQTSIKLKFVKIVQNVGVRKMFYERLKKICNENGTSPTALVRDMGMSSGNVTKWKEGGYPSIKVLKEIAKRFNVSLDYLLEMEGN